MRSIGARCLKVVNKYAYCIGEDEEWNRAREDSTPLRACRLSRLANIN